MLDAFNKKQMHITVMMGKENASEAGPLTGGEVGISAQPAKDCKGNPGSFRFSVLRGARFCLRQETEVQ